jgi:hypothetical protein
MCDSERRLRIIYVTPELVIHLATGMTFEVAENDIPAGAIVRNVAYSPEKHAFAVLLQHDSFEYVPLGAQVRACLGPQYRRCDARDTANSCEMAAV